MNLFYLQIWSSLGLGIAIVCCSLIFFRQSNIPTSSPKSHAISSTEYFFAISLITIAFILRIVFAGQIFGADLTMDENAMARVYVNRVLSGEKFLSGATQIVQALLFEGWYFLFGVSAYCARLLSVFLGIVGILFLYLFVKKTFGIREALWTAVIISISPYSIYFSSLALECVSVLFFAPLLLLVAVKKGNSTMHGVIFGLLIGISCLTYPGQILACAALALGIILSRITRKQNADDKFFDDKFNTRFIITTVLFFTLIVFIAYLIHSKVSMNQAFLFQGGGNRPTLTDILNSLSLVLADLWVDSKSWYLLLSGTTFIERSWLMLAVYGAIKRWEGKNASLIKALLFSALAIVTIILFTGNAAGMRRGIFLFIPVSILAGIAIVEIFQMENFRWLKCLVVVSLLHSLIYDLYFFPRMTEKNFGTGYCTPAIPDQILKGQLGEGDVFLSSKEYYYPLDRYMHEAYADLFNISGRKINFISEPEVSARKILTWNPQALLLDSGNYCVRIKIIGSNFYNQSLFSLEFEEARPAVSLPSEEKELFCGTDLKNFLSTTINTAPPPHPYGKFPFFSWCDPANFATPPAT